MPYRNPSARASSRPSRPQAGFDAVVRLGERLLGENGLSVQLSVKPGCTEAGMYALRERRQHVTQGDFEMAVSKVMKKDADANISVKQLWK